MQSGDFSDSSRGCDGTAWCKRFVSRKTGIVVHDPAEGATHELRSWGRRMALYKEGGENAFRVDSYHDGDGDKKYKKFIRKNARFLKELFGVDSNVLSIGHGGHGLKTCLDEDVQRIVSADVRSEMYLPMAYEQDGVVKGGMYAYMWRCEAVPGPSRSLLQRPVTSIVTGMCMFGSNIWGVDQMGAKHPLTNTFYAMPKGARIDAIFMDSEALHPYENMMLRMFDLQLPMFKAMGQGQQKVFFQAVFEEYVLYGIQLFLLGQMALPALCAYVDQVRLRATEIRRRMLDMCERHGVDFDGGHSTLGVLFGGGLQDSGMSGIDIAEGFINRYRIDVAMLNDGPDDFRLKAIERVFWDCIERLSSQRGSDGEVWLHVEQVLREGRDENVRYDYSSLLTLNFLNYAAKVAIVRKNHPDGELCLSHPFHEKPMALAYKDLHAEKFGGILSLNWVPPVFSHGPFKDGLYYLEDGKDGINELIDAGVLDLCGLEVGAEAVRSVDLKNGASERLREILDGRRVF